MPGEPEAEAEIDAMLGGKFGAASSSLVIEEFMRGEEASFFALCDGETAFPLAGAPEGALRIALFHSPGYFDTIADQVHFAFAGHTHGGQVRVPLLPPLWMPNGSGRFVAGWYEAQPGAASSAPTQQPAARLYVSRGVGTSILPLRFNCRPEVALITVTSGE